MISSQIFLSGGKDDEWSEAIQITGPGWELKDFFRFLCTYRNSIVSTFVPNQ